MKMFDDANMITGTVQGFGFSAVRPETLGSSEYTVVSVAVDVTGSLEGFEAELLRVLQASVGACRKSPRSDFVLLRVLEFNAKVREVHGFKPLSEIDPAQYKQPKCGGMTALRDAVFAMVSATNAYAKTLAGQDYLVNGLGLIITDGDDNLSAMTNADVKAEIKKAISGESLESMRTVLVGVNTAAQRCAAALQQFQQEVGIDQYVDVAEATPQKLAKLADFLSKSISAQSQSLGTGGPSQALVF